MTASIAIIGTEGSGKTVLTTTLAKRLGTIDSRGVFLNPRDVKTLKYVEGAWQTLQDGDWPPSTTPGELFELRWKFEIVGETEAEVRLVDAAGQDLRLLFAEDRYGAPSSLPDALQKLADYCRAADMVLFLVNLGDFIGVGDPERRTDNQAAIKGAMDHLSADGRPRRFCVVFTQVDRYKDYAAAHGGWLSVARDAIPIVFSAYVARGNTVLFPVSAVNTTTVEADDSGKSHERPAPGFGSEGFDKLIDWLGDQVQEFADKTPDPEPLRPPPWPVRVLGWLKQYAPRLAAYIERNWLETIEKYWKHALGVVAVAMLVVLLLLRGCPDSAPPPPPPMHPAPVIVDESSRRVNKRPLWVFNWYVLVSRVTVKNEGLGGKVFVETRVEQQGNVRYRDSTTEFLNAGETKTFTFQLTYPRRPYNVKNRVIVPGKARAEQ